MKRVRYDRQKAMRRKTQADGMVGYLMVFAIAALFLNYIAWLTGSLMFQSTNSFYNVEASNIIDSISSQVEAGVLFISADENSDVILNSTMKIRIAIPDAFRNTRYTIKYFDGRVYFNTSKSLPGLGIISVYRGIDVEETYVYSDIRELSGPSLYVNSYRGELNMIYLGGNQNG